MNKDLLGFVLLPAGLAAVLGGLWRSAEDRTVGTAGMIIGIVLIVFAYRFLRPATSPATEQEPQTPPPQ